MEFFKNLAEGCMPFLYFLREIANPFFDFLFALITHLGEETVFLALAIFIFWCVDKREGYYVLITGLVGTVVNQFLKLLFRVPRPWVLDTKFKDLVVPDAFKEATGYSFPSGHTQNIAGTFGSIAAYNRKRWLTASCTVIILLVAFSRMYLGVHTPLDVGVSLLIALCLVVGLHPLFESEERFKRAFPYIVIGSVILSLGLLTYVLCISGDTTLDAERYASGLKNACTLTGCTVGLILVYFVDTKVTDFKTGARWYAQIIKLAVGLGIVLAIKAGLSKPLTLLFGNEYVARSVRYFLIVAFAGAVWPLTFEWFGKLRIGALEKFGNKAAALFKK